MTSKSPQNLRILHSAMLDLFVVMSRPQRDDSLLQEAGVALDRALFPLLVAVDRFGAIGVVDLADAVGRDHTTVSRQIAKLEMLGLVQRRAGTHDRRLREAILTDAGRTLTDALHEARARIAAPILAHWSEQDFADLVRLMRRFVDDVVALPE